MTLLLTNILATGWSVNVKNIRKNLQKTIVVQFAIIVTDRHLRRDQITDRVEIIIKLKINIRPKIIVMINILQKVMIDLPDQRKLLPKEDLIFGV